MISTTLLLLQPPCHYWCHVKLLFSLLLLPAHSQYSFPILLSALTPICGWSSLEEKGVWEDWMCCSRIPWELWVIEGLHQTSWDSWADLFSKTAVDQKKIINKCIGCCAPWNSLRGNVPQRHIPSLLLLCFRAVVICCKPKTATNYTILMAGQFACPSCKTEEKAQQ